MTRIERTGNSSEHTLVFFTSQLVVSPRSWPQLSAPGSSWRLTQLVPSLAGGVVPPGAGHIAAYRFSGHGFPPIGSSECTLQMPNKVGHRLSVTLSGVSEVLPQPKRRRKDSTALAHEALSSSLSKSHSCSARDLRWPASWMICSSSVQAVDMIALSSDGSQSSRLQSGSSPVNSLTGGALPLRGVE
jgi:hypothetical protein